MAAVFPGLPRRARQHRADRRALQRRPVQGELPARTSTCRAGFTLDDYFEHIVARGLRGSGCRGCRQLAAPRAAQAHDRRVRARGCVRDRDDQADEVPGYFLIVWDFIRYAREQRHPGRPGRGSAAGTLVAYCLRITDVDPIEYDLIFERFLNPERVSLPDIDIDFCERRRGEVIEYVTRKYGRENVAQIITFGTMKAKAVVRDVGRVLDMPLRRRRQGRQADPAGARHDAGQGARGEPRPQGDVAKDERVKELLAVARRLEGMTRSNAWFCSSTSFRLRLCSRRPDEGPVGERRRPGPGRAAARLPPRIRAALERPVLPRGPDRAGALLPGLHGAADPGRREPGPRRAHARRSSSSAHVHAARARDPRRRGEQAVERADRRTRRQAERQRAEAGTTSSPPASPGPAARRHRAPVVSRRTDMLNIPPRSRRAAGAAPAAAEMHAPRAGRPRIRSPNCCARPAPRRQRRPPPRRPNRPRRRPRRASTPEAPEARVAEDQAPGPQKAKARNAATPSRCARRQAAKRAPRKTHEAAATETRNAAGCEASRERTPATARSTAARRHFRLARRHCRRGRAARRGQAHDGAAETGADGAAEAAGRAQGARRPRRSQRRPARGSEMRTTASLEGLHERPVGAAADPRQEQLSLAAATERGGDRRRRSQRSSTPWRTRRARPRKRPRGSRRGVAARRPRRGAAPPPLDRQRRDAAQRPRLRPGARPPGQPARRRTACSSAELHLNPAEMGPVSVQIRDGRHAGAHRFRRRPGRHAAMRSRPGLPELASALRDAGLTLTGGGVSQHARGARRQPARLGGRGAAAAGARPRRKRTARQRRAHAPARRRRRPLRLSRPRSGGADWPRKAPLIPASARTRGFDNFPHATHGVAPVAAVRPTP